MARFLHNCLFLAPLIACVFSTISLAAEPAKPAADLFEKEVLPILQAHCFSCHGAEKKVKGGLDMSSREALLKGSDNGAVVSLEKPDTSMMIDAIRHGELKMPPKGKLPLSQIEILEKWINPVYHIPAAKL